MTLKTDWTIRSDIDKSMYRTFVKSEELATKLKIMLEELLPSTVLHGYPTGAFFMGAESSNISFFITLYKALENLEDNNDYETGLPWFKEAVKSHFIYGYKPNLEHIHPPRSHLVYVYNNAVNRSKYLTQSQIDIKKELLDCSKEEYMRYLLGTGMKFSLS